MNNIKVSDEYLKTIQKALELYMRCSIGQFEKIVDVPSVNNWYWENKKEHLRRDLFDQDLRNLHKQYTGHGNGGPGIHNKEKVTDDARDAMNIHDQIRHHLWKKKGKESTSMFLYEYDAMVKLIEIE
jgi:hypothetical protein